MQNYFGLLTHHERFGVVDVAHLEGVAFTHEIFCETFGIVTHCSYYPDILHLFLIVQHQKVVLIQIDLLALDPQLQPIFFCEWLPVFIKEAEFLSNLSHPVNTVYIPLSNDSPTSDAPGLQVNNINSHFIRYPFYFHLLVEYLVCIYEISLDSLEHTRLQKG